MASAEFAHLHNHSEYSLLDGMLKITNGKGGPSEFLKSLPAKGMNAVAVTDHGNMYGAADFYFAAREAGVRPLIGCEVYVAKAARTEKNEPKLNGHMTLLARDFEGYQNLMAMVSSAFLEGFHYSPRIDLELLEKHSRGVIALSGCLKSHLSQHCLAEDTDAACALALKLRDIMGEGNFYIELMDHNIPEEQQAMRGLLEVARKTGIPLVATNDCHYPRKEDWEAHDVHLCISTGSKLNDPQRLRMTTHELYFKSAEEMAQLFSHTPDAVKNTLVIAERCSVEIPHDKFILPVFDVPEGEGSDEKYLEKLCLSGLRRKLGGDIPAEYDKRLRFELDIINRMKFPSYFLIVSDFINYARGAGVPVGPGRGSGAGSLVAYSLDITRVDPIVNGLLFERFLNPDRISMPDLDIDFSDEGRGRVIEYVRNKYGAQNVAQIITFGTIKAKLAVKDVARVMDFTPQEANALSKLIPNALDATVYSALQTVPELQKAASEPRVKVLLDFAQKLEGLKRHTGVHAAGVVVTREAAMKYTPLAKGSREVVTTQYEGETLSKLGLLKIDFLGLRTLTVIEKTVEMVRSLRGVEIDLQKIPLDDAKTYELLCSARTTCVFQLESRGMRDLVRALKPHQFSEISALVALYRPGPMQSGMLEAFVDRKHGRKKIVYDHPLLEPILKETYGTLIYQEQVMEVAKSMAGFTPGEADGLRKAMGKKNVDAMLKMREKFLKGCHARHIPDKLAGKIFDQMAEFAGYGFNKSHSVAYALVAYHTAYLKANYPTEFMASALTSEIGHNAIGSEDKENRLVNYLDDARDMGIAVLAPDVSKSQPDFSIEKSDGKDAIRVGLRAVKNVGDEAALAITAARSGGEFKSLDDFLSRISCRAANKKTFESLARAGALDSLYPGIKPEAGRACALALLDAALEAAADRREEEQSGQASLFGAEHMASCIAASPADAPQSKPLTEHDLLASEKEMLGFYVSGHPLVRYKNQLRMAGPLTVAQILEKKTPGPVRVAGLIDRLSKKQSKRTKEPWAQFELEDLTASIRVNVFPKKYQQLAGNIAANGIVVISGKVNIDAETENAQPEIFADDVVPLMTAMSRYGRNIMLDIPAGIEEETLKALHKALLKHKGGTQVYMSVHSPSGARTLVEADALVDVTPLLLDDIEKLLGRNSWLVETA
ncbi:MAG: DNA polymerase III subunit alpha [Elusimicrobiales bacterium]